MGVSLEPRLQAVADEVSSKVHADIGSDHALLPRYLLESGRAQQIIVVEKNQVPFENSRAALSGLKAEVRLGDGLGPLQMDEADSLSLTGMGAKLMVKILSAQPAKLPSRVILQPNDSPEPLRGWALQAGFHLLNEQMVEGFWRYSILSYGIRSGLDPAYTDIPVEVALRFGPLLIRQRHPLLEVELLNQQQYLQGLLESGEVPKLRLELDLVQSALRFWTK